MNQSFPKTLSLLINEKRLMELANRISNIEESKSIRFASTLLKLKKEGRRIISLNVGEPDFNTPKEILNATKKALDDNHTRYSLVQGIEELRQAIVNKINKEGQWKIHKDQVFIGNGSKHILYNIFQTIIDPLDEVIIPVPYWVTFPEAVKLAGGIPIFIKNKNDNTIDLDAIKNAITPKTKAIIINSPNNPTGKVINKEDLIRIGDLALENNFYVISDEAYEALTFDNNKHVSLASIESKYFQNTLTVQSFSKSYCMTGFRLGYLIAPDHIINGLHKLQSHLSGNNCTFSQYGAIEALNMDSTIVKSMVKTMEKRRDICFNIAKTFLEVEKPHGAFYLFPNIEKFYSSRIPNDEVFCEKLLLETGVAILPGSYFGAPGHVRICFSTSEDEIVEGMNLMKSFLNQ